MWCIRQAGVGEEQEGEKTFGTDLHVLASVLDVLG